MSKESKKCLKDYITDRLNNQNLENSKLLESSILTFLSDLNKKWKTCHRTYTKFVSTYDSWLAKSINLSRIFQIKKIGGRPIKQFAECSARTKTRKIQDLVASKSTEELATATRISLNLSGKKDAAFLVKQATSQTNQATEIKNAFLSSQKISSSFTPTEALALLTDLKLSKHQYITLRARLKEKGYKNLIPSYDLIQVEKFKCYPPKEAIKITESSAEIQLQPLLDITAHRILEVQKDVLEAYIPKDQPTELQFIHKWGIDGSSGQARYKQRFLDQNVNDADLLLVSLVPLQVRDNLSDKPDSQKIIWKNPKCSSTKFCRPISFQFKKETKETTKFEVNKIENQIHNLIPTVIPFYQTNIIINHKLLLTMLDGKAGSNLTDTSTQTCNICKVTPKHINNLEYVKGLRVNKENYKYGISSLHAHIRFFECLIHIAYRLEIQKWQMRDAQEKQSYEIRKAFIIEQFRKELGLLIDLPKQGAGSTNDGNTARRFFENYEKSAVITNLDQTLIWRFYIILLVISAEYDIDTEKFRSYTYDTAKLFVELYNWYKMPQSIHKILIHGADIIDNFILPIGQLAEDAQESRNKDYKFYREHNTRKNSRENTNEDLIKRMLITSDPVISSMHPSRSYKSLKEYPLEAKALFRCVEIPNL